MSVILRDVHVIRISVIICVVALTQGSRRTTAVHALILVSDYTLNNPDTLTKYNTASRISSKVLETVTGISKALLWELCLS